MSEAALAEALALASSRKFEDRCRAAPMLVGLLDQSQARTALLHLLLDAEDTYVTELAAEALLRDGSPAAVAIFAKGWMLADEEDTLPQMNDHLYDWAGAEPRPYDWPKIVATLRDMTTAEDDELRAAAATLLADLPTNRLGEDAW